MEQNEWPVSAIDDVDRAEYYAQHGGGDIVLNELLPKMKQKFGTDVSAVWSMNAQAVHQELLQKWYSDDRNFLREPPSIFAGERQELARRLLILIHTDANEQQDILSFPPIPRAA